MNKTYIFSILLSGLLFIITSCEENKMAEYKNEPALYFENTTYGQKDSINHSFFIYNDDITFDTVWVVICTMGFPADYDRPVNLIQTNLNDEDAAIPDIHFIAFNNPDIQKYICVPSNQVRAKIPIVFLRDKSIASKKVRLELTIGSNEYFRPGINEWTNFVITTTDMAVKPTNWDTLWAPYMGSWGSTKMKLIINSTGFTDFDNRPSDISYLKWLAATAKQALIDYNAEHPDSPLCEADGSPVTFD